MLSWLQFIFLSATSVCWFRIEAGIINGNTELFNAPFTLSQAMEYCNAINDGAGVGLSSFDNEYGIQSCKSTRQQQCVVNGGVIRIHGDKVYKQALELTADCMFSSFICNYNPESAAITPPNADDVSYSDLYMDDATDGASVPAAEYYSTTPMFVCMEYEYYFVLSTLIILCFASFLCVAVSLLNKIKDHQTWVNISF
mmetsp:Transcript_15915/g.24485  ORF Transcript_15915/g.24485 Transcript_15915/m.24485 type:complete len:198 (+) Transcript_15915:29-622(+)